MFRETAGRLHDWLDGHGIYPVAPVALLCIIVCMIYTLSIDKWEDVSLVHKVRIVCAYITAAVLSMMTLSHYYF